eukprot:7479159-Heterocapsa_arctica.AAC.1
MEGELLEEGPRDWSAECDCGAGDRMPKVVEVPLRVRHLFEQVPHSSHGNGRQLRGEQWGLESRERAGSGWPSATFAHTSYLQTLRLHDKLQLPRGCDRGTPERQLGGLGSA